VASMGLGMAMRRLASRVRGARQDNGDYSDLILTKGLFCGSAKSFRNSVTTG
jgi:hypothetical protein